MRRLNSNITMNFISEKGGDVVPKTYVAYLPLEELMCITVSESYDNEVEINSAKLAVEAALTAFERNPSFKKIKEYLQAANEQILLHSTKNKLKVSLTILVSDYTRMRYGVCGNTKIHVLYEELFSLISKTQTKQEELLEEGKEGAAQEEIHNLTQYLGKGRRVKSYLSPHIKLKEGSTIVLSTSNLWGLVSEIELLDAYEDAKNKEEFLDSVQELLLSRQGEQKIGSYSAAALGIEKTFQEDSAKIKKRKKRRILILVIGLSVILVAVLALCFIRMGDRKQLTQIEFLDQKGIRSLKYGNYAKSLEEYEKASQITEKLNLSNWQYIEEKKEQINRIEEKRAILMNLQEGEEFLKEKEYEEAKKRYAFLMEQASYQGEDSIYEVAKEKLEEINRELEVLQWIAWGDRYGSLEEYEEALKQYQQGLELLKETKDAEKRVELQEKIYEIKEKQKAEKEKEKEEEEKEKEEKENEKVIEIRVLLASGTQLLEEGRLEEAAKIKEELLSRYQEVGSGKEEAEKLYQDIVSFGQGIVEAEGKKQEEERNKKLQKAQEYQMKGAETARKSSKEKAIEWYEKALAIYKQLKIWDESVEKLYEEIEELETAIQEEAKTEKLTSSETPAKTEEPIPSETPVKTEEPTPSEIPVKIDKQTPSEVSAKTRSSSKTKKQENGTEKENRNVETLDTKTKLTKKP